MPLLREKLERVMGPRPYLDRRPAPPGAPANILETHPRDESCSLSSGTSCSATATEVVPLPRDRQRFRLVHRSRPARSASYCSLLRSAGTCASVRAAHPDSYILEEALAGRHRGSGAPGLPDLAGASSVHSSVHAARHPRRCISASTGQGSEREASLEAAQNWLDQPGDALIESLGRG